MNRRRFIKGSMAMAAVCGSSGIASLFSQAAFAAESDIADGKIVRFDFCWSAINGPGVSEKALG
ncbi:glucan biosynthesis protein D, partial [Salmonella enterica subsp. enterica serovar Heidelberg str. N189]